MIEILYRDEEFIAVDKPSGMLVHRNSWCPREPACLELLRDQIGRHVFPVHRIDRATSGVLIFALASESAALLAELFRRRRVRKSYLAVVRGFTDAAGRLDDPLNRENGKEPHRAVTDYRRQAAVELQIAVGKYPTARYSLVRVTPHTGRHHQIRRHFAHASHPVIGDTKHGDSAHNRFFREQLGIDRLLLMATDLAFRHPLTGSQVRLHSAIPAEINHLFARIGWPVEPGYFPLSHDAPRLLVDSVAPDHPHT